MRLPSCNTYTGPTEVAEGTLAFAASQRLSSLRVGAGARAAVAPGRAATVVTRELSIAGEAGSWLAQLDLAGGAVAVDYIVGDTSRLQTIADQVRSGRAGGAWDGQGIVSSVANGTSVGVGYAESAFALGVAGGVFGGEAVDGSAVLIRATRYGDADLDGTVDVDDLLALRRNLGAAGERANWQNGDFDYDGRVGPRDLALLRRNFGATMPAAAFASSPAAVPEPATAAAVLSLGALILRRNRRVNPACVCVLVAGADDRASPHAAPLWYAGARRGHSGRPPGGTMSLLRSSSSRPPALGEALERRVHLDVTGRHLFYNNSAFDGHDPAPTFADVDAVAPDKVALLPGGGTATFANVSTYARGINGILIDFAGIPARPLTAADFEFRAGRSGPPDTWAEVAPTAVAELPSPTGSNTSRYAITFATGAIRNTWLRGTVKANDGTGLATPDVFYFGNLFGDTGFTPLRVNLPDYILVRVALGTDASDKGHPYDFDRDGTVTPIDLILVRQNVGVSLRAFTAPAAAVVSPTGVAPGATLRHRAAYGLPSPIDQTLAAI
jgi:hypothetical protein